MNILITGGAGFIGSHLADRLLARGDSVTVIDNFATGRRDNLAPHIKLQIIEGDIADPTVVRTAFAKGKPEIVIHAAAAYKDPNDWTGDVRTNVLGTAHVAQACKEHGVTRIIYFQTSLCYGLKPLEQPITLNHPVLPRGSSYAISKTAAEDYLFLSGLELVSFRLANAYGPRNLSGPLPTFYHRLTEGKPCFVMDTRRDFIYIDDLVDCVMGAVDGKGKGVYHIASGTDYAIKELFDAVIAALNITLEKPVEVKERGADDVATILLDPSRTEKDFQWKITTPLVKGVAKAIDWYKTHGIEQTYTHLKQFQEPKEARG